MGRPRYSKDDDTAQDRLKHMFWEQLKETPYEKMTARNVAAAAGVNKNTLYYHYNSLDDLARDAVSEVLDPRFVSMLAHVIKAEAACEPAAESLPPLTGELATIADRVCIIASSRGADDFRDILKDAVGHAWGDAFGFEVERLSQQDRLTYEFALGGFVSLLAFRARGGNRLSMADIVHADFAPTFFQMLEGLGKG